MNHPKNKIAYMARLKRIARRLATMKKREIKKALRGLDLMGRMELVTNDSVGRAIQKAQMRTNGLTQLEEAIGLRKPKN